MPTILETFVYLLAYLAGPLVFHHFAIWYSKSFRWLASSVVIQVAFFAYWLSQHPQ